MSKLDTKIRKTINQKRGGSIRRNITAGNCIVCSISINKISNVIMDQTQLPLVISNLITEYFEDSDQFIGYILLHERSRRCVHVSCIICWEYILHTTLEDNKIFIKCVHHRCDHIVDVFNREQSIIY
jgi:hypothetical protein